MYGTDRHIMKHILFSVGKYPKTFLFVAKKIYYGKRFPITLNVKFPKYCIIFIKFELLNSATLRNSTTLSNLWISRTGNYWQIIYAMNRWSMNHSHRQSMSKDVLCFFLWAPLVERLLPSDKPVILQHSFCNKKVSVSFVPRRSMAQKVPNIDHLQRLFCRATGTAHEMES